MTDVRHTVEPIRTQGGLRRLRGGAMKADRGLNSSVLTKAQFRILLKTEIDRALGDDQTLLVASLRIRPLPGRQDDGLKKRKIPDELLQRIRSVHENLRVAVVSDEELMLLLPSLRRRPDGEATVNHLVEVLHPPITVDGLDHHLAPVVGAAMLDHESQSADLLVDGARLALTECDKTHPAMMFHPYQRVRQERKTEMQSDLRAAVLDGGIGAALQPAFDIETGELVALEAFARWNREGKGPVAPWEFVNLAREIGVDLLLSKQVLTSSVKAVSQYLSDNPKSAKDVTLWLNVAPEDVLHPEFVPLIADAIKENESITIGMEISPSPDTGAREVHRILKRLVAKGARAAVGDFGIGNANLTILQQLPFDAIKLDRALIRQIAGSSDAADLVGALIDMGNLLKLETTAQGIEGQSQLDVLADLGCSIGQGYFFAEPSESVEELDTWFTRTA